jgi:hypothetical protein
MLSSFISRSLSRSVGMAALYRDRPSLGSVLLGHFSPKIPFFGRLPAKNNCRKPNKANIKKKENLKTDVGQVVQLQQCAKNTKQSMVIAIFVHPSSTAKIEFGTVDWNLSITNNSSIWHPPSSNSSPESSEWIPFRVAIQGQFVEPVDHASPLPIPHPWGKTVKGNTCKTCDRKRDFCARHEHQRP